MNIEQRILQKTIVFPFYKRHTGLLLFVFFMMFGVVNGTELVYYHLSLIRAMLESPVLMLIVMLIWLLYGGKSIQFALKKIGEPHQQFLFVTAALPPKKLFAAATLSAILMYAPVLLYSLLIEAVAIIDRNYLSAIMVLLYHTGICCASGVIIKRAITFPNASYLSIRWFLPIHFKKPLAFIYLLHVLNNLRNALIVTKIFSLLSMIAFFGGFQLDNYDFRVAMLGFLFALTGHSVIVFELKKFEDDYLGFTRAFPFTIAKRMLLLSIVYFLLLLPELIVFIRAVPAHILPQDFPVLIVFGMLFLTSLHCLLYMRDMLMDEYLIRVSVITAAAFFLVIFSAWWVGIGFMLAAIPFILVKYYYRFEPNNG